MGVTIQLDYGIIVHIIEHAQPLKRQLGMVGGCAFWLPTQNARAHAVNLAEKKEKTVFLAPWTYLSLVMNVGHFHASKSTQHSYNNNYTYIHPSTNKGKTSTIQTVEITIIANHGFQLI